MKKLITILIAVPLLFVACQNDEVIPSNNEEISKIGFKKQNFIKIDVDTEKEFHAKNAISNKNASFENYVNSSLNESLAEYNIQLASMELLGADGEAGTTVFFKNVGNQKQPSDWVPNDPRNWWPTNPLPPIAEAWDVGNVPYWVDGIELATTSGMSAGQTLTSIDNAMNIWENVNCAEGLKLPNYGATTVADYGDVGLIQWFRGFGGKPFIVPGSILHAGIVPLGFFDAISPGDGTNIIAVTFTWIYFSGGEPTDIDQNGKYDTSYKETYYNDSMPFQDEPDDEPGNGIVDFETVVLHEVGHALSQTHFGKAFATGNGKVHFAPYALMNPSYSIGNREVTNTDEAGHCSIWANWPAQ